MIFANFGHDSVRMSVTANTLWLIIGTSKTLVDRITIRPSLKGNYIVWVNNNDEGDRSLYLYSEFASQFVDFLLAARQAGAVFGATNLSGLSFNMNHACPYDLKCESTPGVKPKSNPIGVPIALMPKNAPCDVCYGSGYFKGFGAPCSNGCKP